jgi:hypothetical protein
MIAHQAVGVDLPTRFLARLGQGLDKVQAINIIKKDVLPAVSSAQDVIMSPRKFNA